MWKRNKIKVYKLDDRKAHLPFLTVIRIWPNGVKDNGAKKKRASADWNVSKGLLNNQLQPPNHISYSPCFICFAWFSFSFSYGVPYGSFKGPFFAHTQAPKTLCTNENDLLNEFLTFPYKNCAIITENVRCTCKNYQSEISLLKIWVLRDLRCRRFSTFLPLYT